MPSATVSRIFVALLPLLVPFAGVEAQESAWPASRPVAPAAPAAGHAASPPAFVTQADAVLDFTLDDGGVESASQVSNEPGHDHTYAAVWLNRFIAGDPLTIDTVSIYWASAPGLEVGMQPMLVAYLDADADGDPTNAVRLGTDKIVSIDALDRFQTYTVNFTVPGPGDLYIGFVDLWAHTPGGIAGLVYAAARDTSMSLCRSYVAFNRDTTTATDIDDLGANGTVATMDALGLPGNLMIRATGVGSRVDPILRDGFDADPCTWYYLPQSPR